MTEKGGHLREREQERASELAEKVLFVAYAADPVR